MPQNNNSGCASLALIVIGLMILIPSGLCTGFFALGSLVEVILKPGSAADGLDMLPMALIVGGPFVVVGGLLVWSGIRAGKRKDGDSPPPG